MLDVILLNAVAVGVALTWTLGMKVRPLCLAPAALVLTHILVIQAWVMGTGLSGELNINTWRWVAMGAGLFTVGTWWLCWGALGAEWAFWRLRIRRVLGQMGLWRWMGAGLCLDLMLIWLAVTGWLVGANIPDVINYYLAPPTDWVADGALTTRNWRDPRAMWPQGHGLLTAWWMAGAGSLRAGMLSELHWLALAWAGVWALTRRLGGSARQAAGAMVLVGGLPVVWAQCTSGLNDLAVSSLALLAVACWCAGRLSKKSVALGLAAIIVGIGVKPTMAFLAIGVGVVGLMRWVMGGASGRMAGGVVCMMLLVAVITGGYWYGRNVAVTGNPFYPQAVFVGERKVLAGHDYIDQSGGRLSVSNMTANLFDLFYEKAWDVHRIESGQTERGTGFGPIGSALGLTGLLGLLLFVPKARPTVLALGLMTCLLAAGVHRDVWNGRFFGFLALAGTAGVALIYGRLGPEIARSLWGLMIASAMLFGVWYGVTLTVPGLGGEMGSRGMVWDYWQEEGVQAAPLGVTLPLHPSTYLAGAVKEIPAGSTIALVYPRGIKGPAALMHGEDLSRRLIYLHDQLPTLQMLIDWYRSGVGYVVVMETGPVALRYDAELVGMGLVPVGPSVYRMPGGVDDEAR